MFEGSVYCFEETEIFFKCNQPKSTIARTKLRKNFTMLIMRFIYNKNFQILISLTLKAFNTYP